MSASAAIPAEAYLVQAMWTWAAYVFEPSLALRRAGVLPDSAVEGELPRPLERGLGRHFSDAIVTPLLLDTRSEHAHLVEEFDRMGEIYEAFVKPFSTPIFTEALRLIRRCLPSDARVLDAGCGAGRELQRMARAVPRGEVVGIDLAAGMVNAAYLSARSHALDNCAFVQADVSNLPPAFEGRFDLIYSCLAHHHYPEPAAATAEIHRVLRPGGIYAVIDAGPEWFNRLAAPLAARSDPGWIGFHSPAQFQALMRDHGFARVGWVGTLPGFGVAFGQKD